VLLPYKTPYNIGDVKLRYKTIKKLDKIINKCYITNVEHLLRILLAIKNKMNKNMNKLNSLIEKLRQIAEFKKKNNS